MFGSLEYFIFIFYIFKYFFKLIFIDSIVFQSFFVLYNYFFLNRWYVHEKLKGKIKN